MNTLGDIRTTLEGIKYTEGVMCRIWKDIIKHTKDIMSIASNIRFLIE